jgi:hypothetical protein
VWQLAASDLATFFPTCPLLGLHYRFRLPGNLLQHEA